MKLTTMTQITIDGVVQGNGHASDEDRRNGFERGGWARGAGDDETRALITATYQRADAFLFGRRTYELFAGSWGTVPEMRTHPVGAALNKAPKYVVSTTLRDPEWNNSTVLGPYRADTVRDLKDTVDGDIYVSGSGTLVRAMLADGLVDELHLFVYPVARGEGERLLADGGPATKFTLAGSEAYSNGVVHLDYAPAG